MDFYERLNFLIKKNGLSQAKLEKAIGISNGSVSKWKKSLPSIKTIKKIAEFLNVSDDWLLTGKDGVFTKEIAETDAKLLFMNKEIKEYALKLNNLPKEKQKIIMDLIDQIS